MRNGIGATMCGCIGLALSAGCTVADTEVASGSEAEVTRVGGEVVEASVILRVEVEPNHSVTFYEPTPGGLFLVETKTSAQKFVLGDREASDALAAFARIRPQAEVPAALHAAYDRAQQIASESVTVSRPRSGGGQQANSLPGPAFTPGVVQQALTSSSSAANFVDNDGGCDWGPTWSFCRVNWGGGFFATATATSGLCIVDHYAGNGVVIQITVGSTISSVFQGVGTIAQYSLGAASGAVTRRIDVTNASGDAFHAGCRWGV